MQKKIIVLILGLVLLLGIIILLMGRDKTNESGLTEADNVESVDPGTIKILNFDHKKNVFGKWVISGELKNTSDYDVVKIEFEVGFSDNTEFVTFEDMVSANGDEVPFELKVTGHKGKELEFLKVRDAFSDD